MGYWIEDKYYYTRAELQDIAGHYKDYLDTKVGGQAYDKTRSFSHYNVDQSKDAVRLDMLSSKIDFDRALNAMGRGHWSGMHFGDNEKDLEFKTYRGFSRKQRIVIAEILGVGDYVLEQQGFYDIDRYRKLVYIIMANWLNGKRG